MRPTPCMRWIGPLLVAVSCRPTAAPVPSPPAPSPPAAVEEATIALEVIEQQVLTEIPAGFDPSGHLVVSEGCQVWERSGVFRGELPEDPCLRWIEAAERHSPDRRRLARADGAAVRLEGEGVEGRLECEGCGKVLGLAWSPYADRLALIREGRNAVEIWSVSRRRRIQTLPLGEEAPLVGAELAWPGALHLLATLPDPRPRCDDFPDGTTEPCLDFYDLDALGDEPVVYSLFTYARLDAAPTVQPLVVEKPASPMEAILMGGEYDVVSRARLDPSGQCVYYEQLDTNFRENIGTKLATIPLAGSCDLVDKEPPESPDWEVGSVMWNDGPRPQAVAITSYTFSSSEEEDLLDQLQYDVEVMEVGEGIPHGWQLEVEEIDREAMPSPSGVPPERIVMSERELGWIGAHGEQVIAVWYHCFADGDDEDDDDYDEEQDPFEWCGTTIDLPEDCEFLDHDPTLAYVLAACGDEATLVGPSQVALGVGDDADHVWGLGWLVTIDAPSGVVLRRLAAPAEAQRLSPASAWVPTTLGPVLDRLVLHEGGALRLIDATSGREVQGVTTGLTAVKGAALSPSGQRLAVTDGDQIEVIDLQGKQDPRRWTARDAQALAWRQDERVVFSGPDPYRPVAAWDVRRGLSRSDALPELGDGPVDPTWRWVLVGPTRIRRLLDGLEIYFDDGGVMLDDGRYEGDPWALAGVMIRLGSDPILSPVLPPKALGSVLEREGLAADFFAGRPIEPGPVTITTAQRDALVRAQADAPAEPPAPVTRSGTRPVTRAP